MLALGVAAGFVGVLTLLALPRARQAGRLDPLHPRLFPTLYVACATLAPMAWLLTRGDLGYVELSLLAPNTPVLLSMAVIGFTLGAAIPFNRKEPTSIPRSDGVLIVCGRTILLFPLILAIVAAVNDAVLTRGMGQGVRTPGDAVDAAAFILPPACLLLVAAGRSRQSTPFAKIDLVIATALIVSLSFGGRRGASIAVFLVLVAGYVSRPSARARVAALLLGLGALLALALAVVTYRSDVLGINNSASWFEVLLKDLASVPFTTGVTANLVDETSQMNGATLIAALVRQLPSPLSIPIFGPVDDTGSFVFRSLIEVSDGQGYGYSIAAEGVLNFGISGAFILPFVMGTGFAWMYARSQLNASRAIHLGYLTACATLPFAWRSDSLGALKGVAYALVLYWLVIMIAREFGKPAGTRGSRGSELTRIGTESHAAMSAVPNSDGAEGSS